MDEIQNNDNQKWRTTILSSLIGLIIICGAMIYVFETDTNQIISQEQCKKLLESKTSFNCQCYNSSRTITFGDLPSFTREQVCNQSIKEPYYNLSKLALSQA